MYYKNVLFTCLYLFKIHRVSVRLRHMTFPTVAPSPRGIMVDGPSVIQQQEIDGAQLAGGHPITGAPGSTDEARRPGGKP